MWLRQYRWGDHLNKFSALELIASPCGEVFLMSRTDSNTSGSGNEPGEENLAQETAAEQHWKICVIIFARMLATIVLVLSFSYSYY